MATCSTAHIHCDGDPIECSVEAMQGQLTEMTRQRDEYRANEKRLRDAIWTFGLSGSPGSPEREWASTVLFGKGD